MDRRPLKFETGASSHVGLVRQRNEDDYLVQPEIGVWAVADGMGGHARGDLASATVIRALKSIGMPASAPDLIARFENRVNVANSKLIDATRELGVGIMGSTIAALLAHEWSYSCLWSGDSRVYRIRAGIIEQLSRDHTEVQELLDRGVLSRQEALTWAGQNTITRAIGVEDDPELELQQGEIEAGDRFVICSDGLTGHVADAEILNLVAGRTPQDACDALITLALGRGGSDNITVIVVDCRDDDESDTIVQSVV